MLDSVFTDVAVSVDYRALCVKAGVTGTIES